MESSVALSFLFDGTDAISTVSFQVCIARYLASDAAASLIVMDLLTGEGPLLGVGDLAELRYTGWLLQGSLLGPQIDSNTGANGFDSKPLRIRLGAGQLLRGWEQGLLGLAKGGRRLLLLPPALAYGDKGLVGNKIPPGAALLYDIEVLRLGSMSVHAPVPLPRDSSVSLQRFSTEIPSGCVELESDFDVDSSLGCAHDKQDGSSTSAGKLHLLSRMAKMGQAVLPSPNSNTAAVSAQTTMLDQLPDADVGLSLEELQPSASIPVPPHVVRQPKATRPAAELTPQTCQSSSLPADCYPPLTHYPSYQHSISYPPQHSHFNQQVALYQTAPAQQQQLLAGVTPSDSRSSQCTAEMHTSVLLTEVRQQNTEVRLAIGQLGEKLDRVLERDISSSSLPTLPDTSHQLLAVLQRIFGDYERLKQDCLDKTGLIERQNNRISELLACTQNHLVLDQRPASGDVSRVLVLEQDKLQLTRQLGEATAEQSSLELKMVQMRAKEAHMQAQLVSSQEATDNDQEELGHLRGRVRNLELAASSLAESLAAEKSARAAAEMKVNSMAAKREQGLIVEEAQAKERDRYERRYAELEAEKQCEVAVVQEELATLRTAVHEHKLVAQRAQEQLVDTRSEVRHDCGRVQDLWVMVWFKFCNWHMLILKPKLMQ